MKTIVSVLFLFFATMSCRQVPDEQNLLYDKLSRAIDYFGAEKYSLSIEVCDSIIALDSTFESAYFERAMSYFALDSIRKSIRDFEKVESLNRDYFADHPGSSSWHARALAAEARYLEAAQMKAEELRKYPEGYIGMGVSPWSWTEGAEYYFKAGFIDSAFLMLDEYFASYAKNVTIHQDDMTAPLRLYTQLLLEKKDIRGAYNKMTEAMRLNKAPADYVLWIEVNILTGDTATAREYLDHYVTEIHKGDETEDAKRLQTMLKLYTIN